MNAVSVWTAIPDEATAAVWLSNGLPFASRCTAPSAPQQRTAILCQLLPSVHGPNGLHRSRE